MTLTSPDIGELRSVLPPSLWVSTGLVLAASVTISRSLSNVRRERQKPFRAWLAVTLVLAVLFVVVQAPSLWSILSEHFTRSKNVDAPMALVGAMFFLIVVHALHVLGGIISLSWVMYRAGQNAYDHEHHMPIRHTALYWHFLDVVWMLMFGTLLALG
jgi:heme/copper-type cytochrome/quinol oxidase subunit 3